MKAVILLVVAAVLFVVVMKWRSDARRARRLVMERLTDERSDLGVVSPTEELFRSAGIPISDDLRAGLATAPPAASEPKLTAAFAGAVAVVRAAVATEPGAPQDVELPPEPMPVTGDLLAMFAGIRMPCDLAPVTMSGSAPSGPLGFATAVAWSGELRDRFAEAVAAIGGTVTWIDAATGLVDTESARAVVTVYERPQDALDAAGSALFPAIGEGQVALKLTAA